VRFGTDGGDPRYVGDQGPYLKEGGQLRGHFSEFRINLGGESEDWGWPESWGGSCGGGGEGTEGRNGQEGNVPNLHMKAQDKWKGVRIQERVSPVRGQYSRPLVGGGGRGVIRGVCGRRGGGGPPARGEKKSVSAKEQEGSSIHQDHFGIDEEKLGEGGE